MKARILSSFISILFFSINCICQDHQLIEANKSQVFQVKVYKKDGKTSIGSAFPVSYEDGFLNLATAAHVLDDYVSIRVYSNEGKSYDMVENRENPALDVGFLSIAYSSTEMPSEADSVALSDKISFIRVKNNWEIIQGDNSEAFIESKQPFLSIKNFKTEDGDSGGPVYVGNAIVGMVSSTALDRFKSLTYLVSMNIIHGVFKDWNIPWQISLTIIKHPETKGVQTNSEKKPRKYSELKYLPISKITANSGCSDNLNNMIDGDIQSAWKCTSHGSTYVYFYLPDNVAVKGFSIYQQGDTDDTQEEIPDGYFRIKNLNIEILLSKLMRNKSITDSGKWVNYELKDALITSSFCLELWTSSVYASAIYEIKIKGYTINNHE